MWENKVKYKTKYFGTLFVNNDDDEVSYEAEINYIKNNKSCRKYIWIILSNIYKNNLKPFIKILNKYAKLHKIGKNIIFMSFRYYDKIYLYLSDYFNKLKEEEKFNIFGTDDFKKINIKKYIENIDMPHITINKNEKDFQILLGYTIINNSNDIIDIELDSKYKLIDIKCIDSKNKNYWYFT